jgi:hypothetical protein
MRDRVSFRVESLEAWVPEGVPIEVGGSAVGSGRISIRLDDEASEDAVGVLDYETGHAEVVFPVRLDLPDIGPALRAAGVEEEIPSIRGVLRSSGEILSDHAFRLSGHLRMGDGDGLEVSGEVLPGT